MDRGSWHCTADRDQDHPQEKEVQEGKMVVWGGLTHSYETKTSKRQRRKGKISPFRGKEIATHSSILAWRIPWTEEPGVLLFMGSQRVRRDWVTKYIPIWIEFQRIARRDKKAFLSNRCREIEENNRMGKTRDVFKKISDTKGTFHAKMGSISRTELVWT